MDDKKYIEATNYLTPLEGSFWNWDEQSDVVTWSSGSTIAFREELGVILGRLSPQGLPPINAVLLLIAATRAYWAEDSLPLQHRLRTRDVDHHHGVVVCTIEDLRHRLRNRDVDQDRDDSPNRGWSELFARLDKVHGLPDELIRTPEAKAELAAIVFESIPRVIDDEIAREVVALLLQRVIIAKPKLSEARGGRNQTNNSLIHDLWPLRRGLEGLSKQSLLLRKETGLDTEPSMPLLDFAVDATTVRALLGQLADDDELGGLSRLARNLAAVVQLPRSISDSDELPLGGVSDLTNRGPLDRLLLSELAHDDLMLATRVALNEALYYRREVPPSFPPERCHVLIDSGLRMWGVPRVFAAGVAMSLASTVGKQTSLVAYRASEANVIPIDLSTREGLIEHLGALEAEAHPGEAIVEFFERVSQSGLTGDVVIITTEAVLDDPDFQHELREIAGPTVYVATVNRHGDFQLWSISGRGRKSHASLRLDLDDLLKPPKSKFRALIHGAIDPNAPAIVRIRPFPFRLPYRVESNLSKEVAWSFRRCAEVTTLSPPDEPNMVSNVILVSAGSRPRPKYEHGVVVVTRNRNLLLFDDPTQGALQLGEGLPFGKCLGSWSSSDGCHTYAIIHRESESVLYLLSVDLVHKNVSADPLPATYLSSMGPKSEILGAIAHSGFAFIIYRSMIEVFDPTTKELISSKSTELPAHWTASRYFFNPALGHNDAWFALSFDGSSIEFQHVPLGKFAHASKIHAMFDRRGHDGAFGVNSEGTLFNITDQTEKRILGPPYSNFCLADVDDDGRRILASFRQPGSGPAQMQVIDTDSCSTTLVSQGKSLAQFDLTAVRKTMAPMRRFLKAFVADEKITLVSKGACWTFAVELSRLVLVELRGTFDYRHSREFEAIKCSASTNLVSTARWDDGSQLWIDSRGLLHLQSSDRSIPEATFLLVQDGVTVWTADGRMLGPLYYLARESTITPDEVIRTILEPFVARLQASPVAEYSQPASTIKSDNSLPI